MDREYIEKLSKILGEELFAKLSDELFNKVNIKYPRIRIKEATEIVECNMAIILIIGVEKARGCTDDKLVERINWYNICSKSILLEKTIANTNNAYEEYINIIIKKVKENEESKSKSNI